MAWTKFARIFLDDGTGKDKRNLLVERLVERIEKRQGGIENVI